MAYPISVKREAQDLRSRGYSYREISNRLKIGKGTAYAWTQDIPLSIEAEARLMSVMSKAQIKSGDTRSKQRIAMQRNVENMVDKLLSDVQPNKVFLKVLLATLYWAEGSKRERGRIQFVNSDPSMIKVYLHAFRNGFKIKESKLRANIHLHEYHDRDHMHNYWSLITNIPLHQFTKYYIKPHSEIRKRQNYKGCIRISYYDVKIAEEIRMIYNKIPKILGVW